MNSKERLDKLLQYQSDIINSSNPKEIEIKSKIFDNWYAKIVNDLEVLSIIKKYLTIECIFTNNYLSSDYEIIKEWLEND